MEPAVLNKLLESRVKDLASGRRGNSKEDIEARLKLVQQTLGLWPLPAKTDLQAHVTGTIQREGYRIEKLRYESRPGLLVTAHLYLPDGPGPWPLIVSAHGPWKGKKAAPVAQARGISFALRGFATLVVDAPGTFGEDLSLDERGQIGAPADPYLVMGAPWLGQYTWDLIRGLEACLHRQDLDRAKVAVTGESDGGLAALFALLCEPDFVCGALVCTAPTLEQKSLETVAQFGLPGLAEAGDFSDMLAIRNAPVLLMAARADDRYDAENVAKTAEKAGRASKSIRFEAFEGGSDYNRRMREAALSFFSEHLLGHGSAPYIPELRPLTDGVQNSYPAGTVPQDAPELFVTDWQARQTRTFQDVLQENLSQPHPDPYRIDDRLAPWLKYGTLPKLPEALTLGLHDEGAAPRTDPSIALPLEFIDGRLATLAGISVPEFLAQLLHLTLPGKPEGWESQALGGDGLSAMIASVKTLISSAAPETAPTNILASGPVASLTARFLKLYRPSLIIDTSHSWNGWADLLGANEPLLLQPKARYLEWPF